MSDRDIDDVTARWQRLNRDQVRELWFAHFTVGEMLPGTIVYDRLRLAIALQLAWHDLRNGIRRLTRRWPSEPGEPEA